MARELAQLGERPRVDVGGVSWPGDAVSMMRANLRLRTASRVLVRVARFGATAFHELERLARRVPWERFAADPAGVEFRVTTHKSKLYHSDAVAQRLAEAVEHRAPAARGRRAGTGDEVTGRQLFVVRVVRDEVQISADSSGELLHRRGYRQELAKAPLRETLAAALLLGARWTGDTPLLDPFCGSGTIPIEGALISRNIAPGLHREFAFERWPEHDEKGWRELRDAALAAQLPAARASIGGSDRDAGAIEAAVANATRAGVAADVRLIARPLSAMDELPAGALVATNPPYGVRVGKDADLRNLYAQLGKVLRARAAGATLAMYLPHAQLASQARLEMRALFRTSNGGLPVTALAAAVR